MINSVKRVFKKVKSEGLSSSIVDFYTLVCDKLYDKKYNIDTYSWVSNDDLDGEAYAKAHASMYQASKVVHLRKVFKTLNFPKKKVIVDIGSGKGRVLLIASEFGFSEARGIEFSPNLCEIAKSNIDIYKERTKTTTNFSIINADAGKYVFNDDEYVFFLYNPFDKVILFKVIQNIKESLERQPRPIVMIYKNAASKKELVEEHFDIKNTRILNILGGDYIIYDI